MTKTQIVTLSLTALYLFYELILLSGWKAGTEGPLIRVDLLLMLPLLLALAAASLFQLFQQWRSRTN